MELLLTSLILMLSVNEIVLVAGDCLVRFQVLGFLREPNPADVPLSTVVRKRGL